MTVINANNLSLDQVYQYLEFQKLSYGSLEGLPQLLTYGYQGIEQQQSLWGLTTNGIYYEFIYIQKNDHPTYQPFPSLHLIEPASSEQLLQVLKSICQLQNSIS